jgi:hypothetical protein
MSKGLRPVKDSLPAESWKDIVEAPGLYEMGFNMKANALGKGQLKVSDLKFIKKFEMGGK